MGVCLERKENPHTFGAPETSRRSHCPSVHTWSETPVLSRPEMSVSSHCWRLQSASLIRRNAPVPPIHDSADGPPLPCSSEACSAFTKTLMPSNICGLHSSLLGCMRERNSLSILLHQYWSRSPSPFPVLSPSACSTTIVILAHSRDAQSSVRVDPILCKPPNSPPNHRLYRSSISTSHDRIAPTPFDLGPSITQHIISPSCLDRRIPDSLRLKPRLLPIRKPFTYISPLGI